ncbi:MAG: hypothetical protein OXB84_09335 [Halobacteriovoraceae bacterium]|nr:hypothetical protein [Halobacteriovoraceae bacterium]
MKKLILICSIVFPGVGMGLEIDEKLTLRILDISDTKKTILINRGLEDGLVVGNHAKFYLTTGVIARAVAVKASPARSIWTIYRVVDSKQMAKDKVMNLKISSAVKLTKDPTKSINPDETVSVITKAIPLAKGADDIAKILAAKTKELQNVKGQTTEEISRGKSTRDWEAWGQMHFSGLSYSAEVVDGSSEGVHSVFGASIGLEKYFEGNFSFIKHISIFGLVHYHSLGTGSLNGDSIGVRGIEYGGRVNYHFKSDPMSYGVLIPFITTGFGVGSVEEVTTTVTSSGEEENTVAGTSAFYFVGLGIKYYLRNGFGMRVFLDYYSRTETYEEEGKDSQGPRMMVGLSYRW